MRFWWFMFACDMLIPFLMIACGRMLWKHPPGSANMVYGYRTKRSMRNADTWRFAQEYCGRLWWKIGWIMLGLSALAHLPFYRSSQETIGWFGAALCTVQCVVMVVSVLPTESALKKKFPDNDRRGPVKKQI